MLRKVAMLLVMASLVFTTACNSSSSTSAAGGNGGTVATAAPGTCPTSNTESFAKTRFVADAALAGGAFKRYIYTPAREGKFRKGANGRFLALIKAAAAGLFVINRLHAAEQAAQANPTLCKLLVAPVRKFESAVSGLIGKAKGGEINPADVTNPSSLLEGVRNAATQGGAGFVDNLNASVG